VRSWLSIGLAVGALAAAGCSAPASQQGVVGGRLVQVGGPAPGVARPVAGAVIAIEKDGSAKTAVVASSGRFRVELPPGTYTFEGTSADGMQHCADKHPVVVTSTRVASTQVECPIR
jgi:hypothetical protein